MKWPYILSQKLKIASFLLFFAAIILLATLWERRNILNIQKSFNSIYQDRLVPATDIFYLSESLYSKRLEMDKIFLSPELQKERVLHSRFFPHNKTIDSLISNFEKTYLVSEESKYLHLFKEKVHTYNDVEKSIVALVEQNQVKEGQALYAAQGKPQMEDLIKTLHKLTMIQSSEGKSLIKSSQTIASNSDILTQLQIALIIIITLVVQILIINSKTYTVKHKKFHLN